MSTFIADLVTSFSAMATELLGFIADIVPVVLPIIGAGLAISLGVKYFKKLTNK